VLPVTVLLLLLAATGALLLRAQIKPLATRLVDLNKNLEQRVRERTAELDAALADLGRLNAGLEERVRARTVDLESANRELEAFSYSVSHDLRAPLRHISGFANMLTEDHGGALDEAGRRYLSVISDSTAHMGRLIDDLLEFSRMGRVDMHRGRFSTADLVKEALAQIEGETRSRRIEWSIGDLPETRGDRALLKQVWMNLLSNAVKYTGRRELAKISVGCRREDGEIVFSVRDNGAGFEMEYAGKLFGVFQRLHRQEEFEGTGIGLANVRRIVARHGGRTWAEGKLGEGAIFFFTLPDNQDNQP
jgi:light-regulated signal transduction histidine kinase (bacteriophytochrome)